jgi:hypothetical protein
MFSKFQVSVGSAQFLVFRKIAFAYQPTGVAFPIVQKRFDDSRVSQRKQSKKTQYKHPAAHFAKKIVS